MRLVSETAMRGTMKPCEIKEVTMARPRADAEGPSAKARMREAFWELLAENPSESVSVRELCARARVNKNAFYYHYANVEELASEALRGTFFPERLAHIIAFVQGAPGAVPASDDDLLALRRICLVASAEGTPALRAMLKDSLSKAWDAVLGTDASTLLMPARLDREFALGGIMGILAHLRENGALDDLTSIRGATYPRHAMELIGADPSRLSQVSDASRRSVG